ncbi:MAG TPA: hypothetical protein VM488_07915 [Pseudobacter sp.]|nr:hypothetical protein [Pseudobacter sp.]
MSFLLASFTTALDPALIEKGNKWYSGGMVQNVKNVSDCVWNADIIGPNKQFRVEVEIIGKEVNHVFCNCGPKLCSHVVALLFELVEKNYPTEKYYPETEVKPTSKGETKVVKSPLGKALQNIDTDKLKNFIKKYAERDQEFRKSFLSEFGNIDIDTHVDRFDSIINSTLKYSNIQDAMDGTKRVLKEADKNLKEENYEVVFAACKAVLTEWAPHVYQIKQAGYVFAEALEKLHDVVLAEGLSDLLETSLFNYIFKLYKSPDIEDYQSGEFWTDAFIFLAPSKEHLEKVITLIDAKLEKTSQYHKSSFLTHREEIEKAIKDY